jgi:hypothetical protein
MIMADASEVKAVPADDRAKRILIYAGVLIVVFLLGLVPMWLMAHSRAAERDEARRELRLCTIQAVLAAATIDARLGNYEPARQAASNFFTDLRTEIDKGSESVFDQSQRETLRTLLAPRDEVVTLLARGDPAGADRLSNIFTAYKKALGSAPAKN